MISIENLPSVVQEVSEAVNEFTEEFPYGDIGDSTTDIHHRLLATAQLRFYLSGVVAELILSKASEDKEASRKGTILTIAEADATPKLKIADYESAKTTQGKLIAATLDEYLDFRKAQTILTDTKAALDFVRERLRELERQSHDLNLRVKILQSDG